ncbi:MAG: Fe-Mn family superoxide dismutase [bacterium]
MTYEPKKFEELIGLEGFSDQLLSNHFALYQGYVANTNKLSDILVAIKKDDKFGTPEYSELNRRFGWEFDGMRLHEYYFGNMIKGGADIDERSALCKKMGKDFGDIKSWGKDFRGLCAMRGIGWVILYYDREGDNLFNVWINEHDQGHLTGCAPILVMDVFEHAYMIDYGIKRAGYIDAFFKVINWEVVSHRFKEAI